MPDLLYQSHSLEKTNEGISGSLTFWENSPVSPFEVGDTFSPIPEGTPLTVEKVSIKDNVLGEYNGKVLRQWEITVEGSNNSSSDGQTYVKYNFTISDNIKSGTMEVTNTGDSPVFSLSVGDTFSVPGIGNVTCTEITGNDEYSNDGTRRWTVIYAWTDGNGESDTRYNFSIEKNGSDNTITTGSRTVTNTGNAPSNVALPDTLNLPGIGNLPCVKVSGSDDYDDNGKHVWTVTHEATNKPEVNGQQHNTKYNISIEKNENNDTITTGSKTVTNSGNEPSDLTFGENLNLPGVGDIPLVKVSASDDYDDDGSHVWTVIHEGSNESVPTPEQQQAHNTKYNINIENGITTGSKTITNTGDTPSNLEAPENLNLPGVGNIPLVKVSASDDYDDDGSHVWTVVHEGSNEPVQQQTGHNTKYNFTVEKSGNDSITTGTKTVTNTGNAPSDITLPSTVNLPGIGDLPCVKVSGSDDYDDNGSHVWTVTYDGSNASEQQQLEHDTKYNFTVEKNGNEAVTTGTKTVTNSGNTPSDVVLPATINLPGIGDINCIKVSASDNYDEDGTRKWTVVYDVSNASEQQQSEHDTKYNFSIEKNENDSVVTGTKTVTSTGDNPTLAIQVGGDINIPGIGDITCTKITANDDYSDNGTRQWTVVYESSNANNELQAQNEKYNINVEKNSNGVVIYSGTKEIITAEQPQSFPASVGDTISFPLIGEVTCVKVTSHNNDDGTWSVIIECSSEGNSSGGGSGSPSLPETEEIINYDLNGYTVRTVTGQLLVLQRSYNYIKKKTITVYSDSANPLRADYDNNNQTVLSETISKETITKNGSSITYYKHVIEVEA